MACCAQRSISGRLDAAILRSACGSAPDDRWVSAAATSGASYNGSAKRVLVRLIRRRAARSPRLRFGDTMGAVVPSITAFDCQISLGAKAQRVSAWDEAPRLSGLSPNAHKRAHYVGLCYTYSMRKTYKYRIYVQNGQRRMLNTMLEECRWVYNQTLAARAFAYEHRITCGLYDTQALLPQWKQKRPSLKRVHSQVLQNVQVRVDRAFQAFFRRVNDGAADAGYPRYKQRDRYRSITYPQYGNGVVIRGNDLIVSKVGRVKVVWHRPVAGEIKTVSLKRSRTHKWYVTFTVEIAPKRLPPSPHVVGVDMGLESFLTTSAGEKVANPRFFRRDEADLKRVQKLKDAAQHAQQWDEHRHRKKALSRIHERIRFRREDFAHKRSRALINTYQVIAFEELAPQQMGKSRGMRKSIADVAWTQLIQYTCNKAEEAGRTVVLVNPRNTSKRCSACGELVAKDLSVRVHTCPHCGLVLDRDQNAALNILRLGLAHLRL